MLLCSHAPFSLWKQRNAPMLEFTESHFLPKGTALAQSCHSPKEEWYSGHLSNLTEPEAPVLWVCCYHTVAGPRERLEQQRASCKRPITVLQPLLLLTVSIITFVTASSCFFPKLQGSSFGPDWNPKLCHQGLRDQAQLQNKRKSKWMTLKESPGRMTRGQVAGT